MSVVNSRLEAFCDGVFAIALTLLIIDIRIPDTVVINNTSEMWHELYLVVPSILAFLLSFIVILITWVNHHNHLKLINKSSGSFLYANGFLLLTVAFTPFPTSLLGNYLFTDHAAPAVILYNTVLSFQAIGWILISRTAINNGLCKSDKAVKDVHKNGMSGLFASVLYATCAIVAIWFPISIACFSAMTWIFWLIFGINTHHEE